MIILGPKTAILGPQFCRILVLGAHFWWSGGPPWIHPWRSCFFIIFPKPNRRSTPDYFAIYIVVLLVSSSCFQYANRGTFGIPITEQMEHVDHAR